MGRFMVTKFYLIELCKGFRSNFVAFSRLKILYNLVSMKYFLNANKKVDISKILKNIQRGLAFIFDVLSESRIRFVSFLVFLALENVVSFTKTRFYQKRSSVTMRNYVDTFRTNIGHSLA